MKFGVNIAQFLGNIEQIPPWLLLTTNQAAELLGITPGALRARRYRNMAPPAILAPNGKYHFYRLADIYSAFENRDPTEVIETWVTHNVPAADQEAVLTWVKNPHDWPPRAVRNIEAALKLHRPWPTPRPRKNKE